jgi:hypothetical protein
MKKYLATLLFLGMSSVANAGLINMSGSVNALAICKASSESNSCSLNENGIRLTIKCSGRLSVSTNDVYCNDKGTMSIESNIPITSIYMQGWGKFENGRLLTDNNESYKDIGVNNTLAFNIVFGNNYYATVSSIRFAYGTGNGLTESLQASDAILYASYSNALTAANMFKGEIAKTHRGHMSRFMAALGDGIQLLDPNNKDKVSIVDWRVQENARLIVVFGTIMNELLSDYDDVERLKTAITALSSLVDQLRVSYGWERGLAGNASKASSALLQVVRLEVQELASIKMAMGDGNLGAYTKLLKTSGILLAKVNASKSGDMKAQREIYDFSDAWNSDDFQVELRNMINAGPDFKNLVLPKLTMLLKSVESINDLADAGLNIPDGSAPEAAPVKAKTKK